MSGPAPTPAPFSASAAHQALQAWLRPMADLALRSGLTYAEFDEAVRLALVQASTGRNVSQITTATGLHRKEVLRLQGLLTADASGAQRQAPKQSWAAQVFLRWVDGTRSMPAVAVLPYQSDDDDQPCFAKLARSVTTDVHPRAVLEDLLRLGLVGEQAGKVKLLSADFAPRHQDPELLRLMADNVAAHLHTAVSNVASSSPLATEARLLEQAVWGDGVNLQAAHSLDAKARDLWAHVHRTLYQAICDLPEAAPGELRHRVQVGMYTSALPQPEHTPIPVSAPPHSNP